MHDFTRRAKKGGFIYIDGSFSKLIQNLLALFKVVSCENNMQLE